MRLLLAVLACAACGPSGVSPTKPQELTFERFSPPQATGHDILLGSSGSTVVMAHRYSLDAGATWQPLDARLGEPTRVAISGTTVALYVPGASGLVRWNLADGTITPVAGAPTYVTDRNWRIDRETARFIAFETPTIGSRQTKSPRDTGPPAGADNAFGANTTAAR